MGTMLPGKKTNLKFQDYPDVQVCEGMKKIEIAGYSHMTNPIEYYDNLIDTIEYYYRNFQKSINLEFRLEFLNTLSVKLLFSMLSRLQSMASGEGIIQITWYYEEDDEIIKELGEFLRSSLQIPVLLVEIA